MTNPIRHPAENGKEVAIQRVTRRHVLGLVLSGCGAAAVFCSPLE